MSSRIVFNSGFYLPVVYQTATNTYYLCQDCVRQHQKRHCSGHTSVSYQLCIKHRDASRNQAFDLSDLTFFQQILSSSPPSNDADKETIRSSPAPRITYSHSPPPSPPTIPSSSEGGCIYSSNPSYIFVPHTSTHSHETHTQDLISQLTWQISRIPTPSRSLAAELKRLQEEIGCSGAAKQVFFRRCNGQWRNALGYELELELEPESVTGEEKRLPMMAAETLANREELVRRGVVSERDLAMTCWAMNSMSGK